MVYEATIMKSFLIIIFSYYIYLKITNITIDKRRNIIIVISSIIMSIIYLITNIMFSNNLLTVFIIYIMFYIITGIISIEKKQSRIVSTIISFAICIAIFVISTIISFIPYYLIGIKSQIIRFILNIVTIGIIQLLSVRAIFKIKRLKNGIGFLQKESDNEYLDICMIIISVIVIFMYTILGNYSNRNSMKDVLISFIIVVVIMLIMIQRTITLYYKQKLLDKAIDDYKGQIKDKDAEIEKLSQEKFKISKLNHEFYNRQHALIKKVNEHTDIGQLETEIGNEIGIVNQINELSNEYTKKLEKIKKEDKIPTTEIEEIDDMFKYMQSECTKNKINFKLQINGNIFYMINNIISKEKLATLIGDHIRDAIIAVNSSGNDYKSIIAFLGKKDKYYEFSVFDTGIEFEINTLLKLGLEPITTHKESGGTGIGFITTFETLNDTKASLIIKENHEMIKNDYTKCVTIRFDGENKYKIISYRSKIIKKRITNNRIILIDINEDEKL